MIPNHSSLLTMSEVKVQKNMSANVHNRLKFAEISRKDLLCTKM